MTGHIHGSTTGSSYHRTSLDCSQASNPSVCCFQYKRHKLGSECLEPRFWSHISLLKTGLNVVYIGTSFRGVVVRWGLLYTLCNKSIAHPYPCYRGGSLLISKGSTFIWRSIAMVTNSSRHWITYPPSPSFLCTCRTPFGREYEVTACTKFNTHKAEDVDNYFMMITGDPREVAPSLS